ncbi:MAG: hypothetical protein P8Y44_04875, partial [Acidobacteriota bacterium]
MKIKTLLLLTLSLGLLWTLPLTAQESVDEDSLRAITAAVNKAALGQIDEAIADLEAMIQAGRDSEPVVATLGALYIEAGNPEKGLEVLAPMA